MGAGVTPAVHSHGPAPLAPVVAGDVRVRTVGCTPTGRGGPSVLAADQTSGTASPYGSLACLSSQVSRRRVLLVALLPYGQQEVRPVGSGDLRIRARITPTSCCPLLYSGSIWAVDGDPLPVQVLGAHGWPLTRDHHAGMGADHSVCRGSGRAGPL